MDTIRESLALDALFEVEDPDNVLAPVLVDSSDVCAVAKEIPAIGVLRVIDPLNGLTTVVIPSMCACRFRLPLVDALLFDGPMSVAFLVSDPLVLDDATEAPDVPPPFDIVALPADDALDDPATFILRFVSPLVPALASVDPSSGFVTRNVPVDPSEALDVPPSFFVTRSVAVDASEELDVPMMVAFRMSVAVTVEAEADVPSMLVPGATPLSFSTKVKAVLLSNAMTTHRLYA